MHDYYTICKVQMKLSTSGSLHSTRYISGENERSNRRLRVCHILSQTFARYLIGIIQGALIQGRGGYEATPIDWYKMQDS